GSDRAHSLVSEDPFVLSGGSLDLAVASKLDGDFTFTNGTLSGAGTLTVNGALTWSGGTMRGPGRTRLHGGLPLRSTGNTFDPVPTLDGRALDNAAAAVWTGRGNVSVGNGASFNNLAGASFSADTDTLATATFTTFGSPVSAFNNAGTFSKLDTSGTTAFNVAFNNSGSVDVQSGTLAFNGGGDSTGA